MSDGKILEVPLLRESNHDVLPGSGAKTGQVSAWLRLRNIEKLQICFETDFDNLECIRSWKQDHVRPKKRTF